MKKDGRRGGRQKYKCRGCGKCFISKKREKVGWVQKVYREYCEGKQTYKELALKYGKDPKTLRKYFDEKAGATGELKEMAEPFVLILDATFFGRGYGILMARSVKKVLYWQEINSESLREYEQCFVSLEAMGYRFSGFVIDGRRGVRQMIERRYEGKPIQLCQFHQIQTVKKYIPQKAKTEAGRDLRAIALKLARTNEKDFERALDEWNLKYGEFLNERTYTLESKRWRYTHGRLRSAYRSLRTNLPYLFTFEHNEALEMPNTTNHCDGLFAHIKQKILIHRGISKARRKKMIDFLLENFRN